MNLIKAGGLFIWPLLICSVLAVAIVADRFIVFARELKTPLLERTEPQETLRTLRKRLITLHTIIVIAPMLGLLGTVTGLMRSFSLLGNEAVVRNPQAISLGISEALITTAAGLLITVVATIFYNYFCARINDYVFDYNSALNKENSRG